jgi:hypothetical protein
MYGWTDGWMDGGGWRPSILLMCTSPPHYTRMHLTVCTTQSWQPACPRPHSARVETQRCATPPSAHLPLAHP